MIWFCDLFMNWLVTNCCFFPIETSPVRLFEEILHQLIGIEPFVTRFYTSQMVVWDFFSINSKRPPWDSGMGSWCFVFRLQETTRAWTAGETKLVRLKGEHSATHLIGNSPICDDSNLRNWHLSMLSSFCRRQFDAILIRNRISRQHMGWYSSLPLVTWWVYWRKV